MALFTERRIAHNPGMIPPTGDRRRASAGGPAGKGIAQLIDPTVEEMIK